MDAVLGVHEQTPAALGKIGFVIHTWCAAGSLDQWSKVGIPMGICSNNDSPSLR